MYKYIIEKIEREIKDKSKENENKEEKIYRNLLKDIEQLNIFFQKHSY